MEPSTSGTQWQIYQKRSAKKPRSASEHSLKRINQPRPHRSYSTETLRNKMTDNSGSTAESAIFKKKKKTYNTYLIEVVCPFCLNIQENIDDMVKHLDTKCRFKIIKKIPFTTFQILPNNDIKCNLCNEVLKSIENYFYHSKNHLKNSEIPDYLFCSSCKMLVLDNYIHLRYHMEHEIHNSRRRSLFDSHYYFERGVQCIYCFYNGNKKFKCLSCPPPHFLFDTTMEIKRHFKTFKHMPFKKQIVSFTIYCCFCDEYIQEPEIPYHFTLEIHLTRANKVTGQGSFRLCFCCGFACDSLKNLSDHMRSNCDEIKKMRLILGLKEIASEKTLQEVKVDRRVIKKERCIVVDDDVDIVELSKTLKKFGKITYVGSYDDHKMVIEFKKEESVETILLFRSFITINGEKLKIQFFGEAENAK